MSKRFQKREDLQQQLAGDEIFLYNKAGGELTVLNKTALLIWSLCDGHHSEEHMADLLSKIYPDAAPSKIRADIQSTLQDFQTQSLIHPERTGM